MTFTYGPGSELRLCPLWSLPPPSLEAFPKKHAGSEVPIPTAWQLGTLYGNMPGALREGKGPGLAQLILAFVGRKLGVGGSPGFPLGQRWVRFTSTQPSLCTTENKLPLWGSKHREPGATQHTRLSTSRLPGQGTQRLSMAPGASKKSWGSVEVALADLCVILLCCEPMLTCCRRVTIFPAVLTLPEGDKATFFCNISMENDSGSEYSLNWYKETHHSQAQKTAEISRYKPVTETEKYRLINHTPVFEIEILNLHKNDSGSYYCGLITFYEPDKVMESNRSQLIVTAAPQINATDEPEMEEGNPSEHIKAMLLGILLLAGVAVLLIFGYLTFTYRRGDVQKPPSENMPEKEDKLPVVSISTVDYGVLEFQRDQSSPVPPKTQPVEQTEYATIIFPEEKPVTPERGKKHLDERTRQLPSQPC